MEDTVREAAGNPRLAYEVYEKASHPDLYTRGSPLGAKIPAVITCGGAFNRSKGAYDDRIIVVAAVIQ